MYPIGPYRNEACRALAEKVARQDAVRTLDVTINIDQIIQGSKAVIAQDVLRALHDGAPFVMYNDTRNYYMVLPAQRMMINMASGVELARTVSQTEKEFANNIRLAIIAYDKFYRPSKELMDRGEKTFGCIIIINYYKFVRQVADRKHGMGEIPTIGRGKEMCD